MKNIIKEDDNGKKEFATILAFDVKVTPEAAAFAEDNGVKIMTANIIYHLFDQFTKYVDECVEERKQKFAEVAVFPCIVEIIKGNVFNNKSPILVGMKIKHGVMRIGTPLCVPDKGFFKIGKVASIMFNGKALTEARPETGDVSVKIEGEPSAQVGR